ncbi:MAG: hypothetical protein H0V30_11570 [Chitinophagaceae bacterium]|jgi:hypothetical protein|nr:hypothetical protein [Chitinophagaceae bacterium]
MKFGLLFSCLIVLQFCNQQTSEEKITDQVSVANGINNFSKVQMLEFIFNVQRDTAPASSRHWQWYPKSNEVVFITDSSHTKFKRTDTSTQELKKLNARFTNDEYWLLFPFHLGWDDGFEFTDSSMKPAPISGKSLHKITIKYNDKDGFTPGDIYDVYIDEKKRIQEWAYHSAGAAKPSLITTWENYRDFNGLQIAQDHKTKDGKFHLWFTGIQIKYN